MFDALIEAPPFSVRQSDKEALLLQGVNDLARHHYDRCKEYARIIDLAWGGPREYRSLSETPFLPVNLFKELELRSTSAPAITLHSSGTTGQTPSKIVVDGETSERQSKALVATFRAILAERRLPFLAIDTRDVIKSSTLTARGAGVLGMMKFGAMATFALTSDLKLDKAVVNSFVETYGGSKFFIFGFTFLIWSQLYQEFSDGELDLSNACLIHSGGWKKLESDAVSNKEFRGALGRRFGLTRIFNFYGLVEQIGSVFVEGSDGLLYPPNFADVIVRRRETLEAAEIGEEGIIQVISLLPKSYPGHSLLTEDIGAVVTLDAGVDGRLGKGIRVSGRIKRAELRGCSDVLGVQAA